MAGYKATNPLKGVPCPRCACKTVLPVTRGTKRKPEQWAACWTCQHEWRVTILPKP